MGRSLRLVLLPLTIIVVAFAIVTFFYNRLSAQYYYFNDKGVERRVPRVGDTVTNVDSAVLNFLTSLRPPGKFYPCVYGTVIDSTTKRVQLHCGSYRLDVLLRSATKIADAFLDLYDPEQTLVPTHETAWRFDFHETGAFSRSAPLNQLADFNVKHTRQTIEIAYKDSSGRPSKSFIKFPVAFNSLADNLYLPCLMHGPNADFYFLHPHNPALLRQVDKLMVMDQKMAETSSAASIGKYTEFASNVYGHCRRGVYSREQCEPGAYYIGEGKCVHPADNTPEAACLKRQSEITPENVLRQVKVFLGDVVDDSVYYECTPEAPYAVRRKCEHAYERFDYDETNKCVRRNPCFEQAYALPRVDQLDVAIGDRLKFLYPNSYATCFAGGTTFAIRDCGTLYPGGMLTSNPPFNYCIEFSCRNIVDPGSGQFGQGWHVESSQYEPNSVGGIVGGEKSNSTKRFAETAITTKTTCVNGRVLRRETARITERIEYVFNKNATFDHKFYIRYWMPEFVFDDKTGTKLICSSFRDAPFLFARTGKLRVYSALTNDRGPLSFVRFSLFIDVKTNVHNNDNLIVETRPNVAIPVVLSSDELVLVQNRLARLGGLPAAQLYACSWIDKGVLFKFATPSGESYEEGSFVPTSDLSLFPRLDPRYGYYTNGLGDVNRTEVSTMYEASVAILRSDENMSLYTQERRIAYLHALLYKAGIHDDADDDNMLGYVFQRVISTKKPLTDADINELTGNCSNPITPGIDSALKYLKNAYIYERAKGIWCFNGAETKATDVPCHAKMSLTFTPPHSGVDSRSLNTCSSLEPVRPKWIITSISPNTQEQIITYVQYTEPTFISNTVTANGPYVLSTGDVVKGTSTLLTVDEYRTEITGL